MKAIILAGGKGTRLYPVTLETPKPLLTIKRVPIINYLLRLLKTHSISEVIVLISQDHKSDFDWWKKRYVNFLPKKLKFAIEDKPAGTFGGLLKLKRQLDEPFILSNGDNLYDFNLKDFVGFHRNHSFRPLATLALAQVENASPFGVPIMEGDRIKEFLEKPENPPSNFVSSGFYILEPEVMRYADRKKEFLMIEKDIFPQLASAGKLFGYKPSNYRWLPCDTIEKWHHAIKNW